MPYVNGVYMAAPGAAVVVNDQNFLGAPNGGGLGTLLIGPALDGQPNTALSIGSPAQALAVLKGGDLLQGALNAFAGAAKAGGSLLLTVIDPTPRTQATSTINSVGAVAQIPLTTTSYGTIADSSKWMVQAGSVSGYKVSQATDFVGPGGQTYPSNTTDNVALSVLAIYYSGTGTAPTYTVSDTQLVLTATTSDLGGTIAFTSTMTVQQLVNQINILAGWSAVVTDPNPNDLVSALFDNITTAATVSTASTSPTVLSANVTAVVRFLNSVNLYFTGTRDAGATSLATSAVWTYATGGTSPAATNSNWQDAYTTAQAVTGVSLVSCVSSSYSIWDMNDAHCHYMTSIGQPRRGYLGDALAATLATEITQAALLNSDRSTLIWPEQKGTDYNGNATTFAPYLVACSVIGERAATIAFDALTQQPVPSQGMGQAVTPGMVAQALLGGVAIIAPNQAGVPVLQHDMTTWLQNTAYNKVENSTGLVADIIVSDLNAALAPFVGKPVTASTVGGAQSVVLQRLVNWYNQGFLAAAPKSTDVSLVGSGDTITGNANVAIDVPANYIVLQLSPTSATVAA